MSMQNVRAHLLLYRHVQVYRLNLYTVSVYLYTVYAQLPAHG